jgi:pilus assembly protein CpaC
VRTPSLCAFARTLCGFARMFAGAALLGMVLTGPFPSRAQDTVPAAAVPENLFVLVGKSLLVESAVAIERVSVGFGEIAEAAAVTDREVLLNGRAPGETSLIIWQRGGGKLLFNVTVGASSLAANERLDAVSRELRLELPGQSVEISFENNTAFLRGRVKDLVSAERAVSIVSTLGRTVNLLYVDVPPVEPQILLKVRFASVDRSASLQLGFNIASTGAGNTLGSISTQQFAPPQVAKPATGPALATISDALNVFLFNPQLNLLATIQALQQTSLLEILAEPNVLAMNGKPASFLAGGEFPFPSFQPSATGNGTVTVTFREYGIRLNFIPSITPRGTIRLQVAPEVSALDFTNGLVVQGYTIPALTVRKVDTEIELKSGQSFAIAGLIDDQFTETLSKIPFIGDLPVLGKLFQSKSRAKNNTELLVIITPEIVSPAVSSQAAPEMTFPQPLLWPRAVSREEITPVPPKANAGEAIPVETLIKSLSPDIPVKPPPVAATPQPAGPVQTVPHVPSPN